MNFERILDGLVGAKAKPGTEHEVPKSRGFIDEALSAFGLGGDRPADLPASSLAQGFGDARGTLSDWTGRAKEAMGRNPTLTAGAVAATAGLLLSGRGRGLLGSVAGLGGMGLIGALAYNAFRKYQERSRDTNPPNHEALNPANVADRDVQLFARAMVAAIAADGHIDDIERARIASGLREAGLDREGAIWLDREFAKPASVEELAAGASSPERAAQLYSAARLVIEPDTDAERAFLKKLAEALNLAQGLRGEIDGSAAGLKTST